MDGSRESKSPAHRSAFSSVNLSEDLLIDWTRKAVFFISFGICFANSFHLISNETVSNSLHGYLYLAWLHAGLIPAWCLLARFYEYFGNMLSLSFTILTTTLFSAWMIWNPPMALTESVVVAFPIVMIIAFYLIWAVIDFLMAVIEHFFGINPYA